MTTDPVSLPALQRAAQQMLAATDAQIKDLPPDQSEVCRIAASRIADIAAETPAPAGYLALAIVFAQAQFAALHPELAK